MTPSEIIQSKIFENTPTFLPVLDRWKIAGDTEAFSITALIRKIKDNF